MQLASLSSSYVTVFDSQRQTHVLACYGPRNLFGLKVLPDAQGLLPYYDPDIHPDDRRTLDHIGQQAIRQLIALDKEHLLDYKLVNEFRVRLPEREEYVRVIEQFQILEQDEEGAVLLSLSVLDLSPNQQVAPVSSQLINYRQGVMQSISLQDAPTLTQRELEVLALLDKGLYSKEISAQLSISVHTVNTHRQRILEKLGADNTVEATRYGRLWGLI